MSIATDPLSLLFMTCFLLGLLFMVATTLMGNLGHGGHGIGHHLHAGGHGAHHAQAPQTGQARVAPSGQSGLNGQKAGTTTASNGTQWGIVSYLAYINPISMAIFLLVFGFFGYVIHNVTDLTLPLALLLAGFSGVVIAGFLLVLLNRLFGDVEGSTTQDVSDRTGIVGKVNITIQENGIGEVLYISPSGMRKSIPARSVDGRRLERDQEIVVTNYQGGVAEVDTWDHFINQDDAVPAILPDSDELAKLRALLDEPTTTEYVMRKDLQKE